jgi:hypothetical protein
LITMLKTTPHINCCAHNTASIWSLADASCKTATMTWCHCNKLFSVRPKVAAKCLRKSPTDPISSPLSSMNLWIACSKSTSRIAPTPVASSSKHKQKLSRAEQSRAQQAKHNRETYNKETGRAVKARGEKQYEIRKHKKHKQ